VRHKRGPETGRLISMTYAALCMSHWAQFTQCLWYYFCVKNLTISLDEHLLLAAKKAAATKGVSLNKFVRDLLQRSVKPEAESEEFLFFRLADEFKPTSGGWKWNREEIYEDAI
jgi:hypothetical protein